MGVKVRKITSRWVKRKDGTREKVELPEPYYAIMVDHKGNRKFKKMKSKEEAVAKAREIEEGLENGSLAPNPPKPPKPVTFKEHAEKWYETHVVHNLKYSTQISYRKQLDQHILPMFDEIPLTNIKRADLKAFWYRKLEEGLSPGTVLVLNAVISSVLTDAVEDELLEHNPAREPGKYIKRNAQSQDFHTAEEGFAILQVAREQRPRLYPLFLTAWAIGAREGELIALQWGDIDWRGKFIVIQRTDYNGNVGTTKTDKVRRVDLANGLAADLESHRRMMAAEALRMGRPMPERVFTTKTGKPFNAANIRRAYYRCQKLAGVRHLTFHASTRRGFGSAHLNEKENLSYVSGQLGHTDIKQTARAYAFLKPGNQEAANRLYDLLTSGKIRKHTQTDLGNEGKAL